MIRTPLCDLLELEAPIVQAPMGGAAGPELVAAVSNAGALGALPIWAVPPERGAELVRATRELTRRPFAVNLLLHVEAEQRLEAALEAGAQVVAFGWGDPCRLVGRARESGAKVLVAVGSPEEALHAVSLGADAIVAQGWEAGGHVWGQIATLALVPATVDAVAPVPVVAAGGIADGRGLAAVLALGAAGAWVGTRFLLAREAETHPEYRRLLAAAGAADTVYGTIFDVGWPDAPHRALRNSTVDAWERAGRPGPGGRPGEGEPVARRDGREIARYASATPATATEGEIEAMSLWAGQGVGLVREELPAAEIVRELVDGAEAVLSALP